MTAPAAGPWEMFAQQYDGHLEHFFLNVLVYTVCGDAPIVRVRVSLDDDGAYWGWLASDHPDNGGGTCATTGSERQRIDRLFAGEKARLAALEAAKASKKHDPSCGECMRDIANGRDEEP